MAMHAGTSQSIPGPLDAAHVDAAAINGLWPLPPACARGIGGFRATWGTKDYAAAATVIAIGRLHGLREHAKLWLSRALRGPCRIGTDVWKVTRRTP